jgi:hypothetical protein
MAERVIRNHGLPLLVDVAEGGIAGNQEVIEAVTFVSIVVRKLRTMPGPVDEDVIAGAGILHQFDELTVDLLKRHLFVRKNDSNILVDAAMLNHRITHALRIGNTDLQISNAVIRLFIDTDEQTETTFLGGFGRLPICR